MRKFGLIGGTSWHSTVEYYSTINQYINDYYGDNTNPPLRLINLDQKHIHNLQRNDDWDAIADIFISAALELQSIGVEGVALCANTPHKIFDQLTASLSIPVLHIADAIGITLKHRGVEIAGLLGTRFTMDQDFIKGRLLEQHLVKTLVPTTAEQVQIQEKIYDELSVGHFEGNTKQFFLDVIDSLSKQGAQAVILGCTEIPLLLSDSTFSILSIDSLQCHCEMIVKFILSEENLALG